MNLNPAVDRSSSRIFTLGAMICKNFLCHLIFTFLANSLQLPD
jgi:hypothetical protein